MKPPHTPRQHEPRATTHGILGNNFQTVNPHHDWTWRPSSTNYELTLTTGNANLSASGCSPRAATHTKQRLTTHKSQAQFYYALNNAHHAHTTQSQSQWQPSTEMSSKTYTLTHLRTQQHQQRTQVKFMERLGPNGVHECKFKSMWGIWDRNRI